MKRTSSALSLPVLAAAIAVTLAPATAYAGTDATSSTIAYGKYKTDAGIVAFQSDGDVLSACDYVKDGAGVMLLWTYKGVPQNPYVYSGGVNGCGVWNRNLTEGKSVTIRACLEVGGDILGNTCAHDYSKATA